MLKKGVGIGLGILAVITIIGQGLALADQDAELNELSSKLCEAELKSFNLELDKVNRELTFGLIMRNHAKRGCPMSKTDQAFLRNAEISII